MIPYRIGISGLLVKKTRNRTLCNDRASAKSCRIIQIFLLSSHSSSASITGTYDEWQLLPSSFDRGRRMSWCHWSRRDWLAILLCSVTASRMYRRRVGTLFASCTATLVTNLLAWPASPLPFVKKKLALSRLFSKHLRATVRAMVDFPVPAKPLSQKMHRLSCPSAYACIL